MDPVIYRSPLGDREGIGNPPHITGYRPTKGEITHMAKEIIWSEEQEFAFGREVDFEGDADFISAVKAQYEDGDCVVTDIAIEPYIYSQSGVKSEFLSPLSQVDITIENYYVGSVERVEIEED